MEGIGKVTVGEVDACLHRLKVQDVGNAGVPKPRMAARGLHNPILESITTVNATAGLTNATEVSGIFKSGSTDRATEVTGDIGSFIAFGTSTPIVEGSSAFNVTGANPNKVAGDTGSVVIQGVSIASKEVLIGLVGKIESGALDEVISELTIAERQAAHALVLEVAKGFNYVNSESVTSSEEPNRVTLPCANVSEMFGGVSLKTLKDIDDFTKDIELGKYEVVISVKRLWIPFVLCGMLLWPNILM